MRNWVIEVGAEFKTPVAFYFGEKDDKGRDTARKLLNDIKNRAGSQGFVRDARAALGGVDILVANAGGPPPGTFSSVTVDQYLDAFELNCRSTIAMCYEAVPAMRERRWGRVVAITSIAC